MIKVTGCVLAGFDRRAQQNAMRVLLRAPETLEQLLAVLIIQLGGIALCQSSVQPK
jgi:hypothetical protein